MYWAISKYFTDIILFNLYNQHTKLIMILFLHMKKLKLRFRQVSAQEEPKL